MKEGKEGAASVRAAASLADVSVSTPAGVKGCGEGQGGGGLRQGVQGIGGGWGRTLSTFPSAFLYRPSLINCVAHRDAPLGALHTIHTLTR